MACAWTIRMGCAIRCEYFERLRERAPDAWIVGEKILEPGEFLPPNWPIEGTSGYDFLNAAAGVLVRPEGMAELTAVYADFIGGTAHVQRDCAREEDQRCAGVAGQRCESADVAVRGDMRDQPQSARLHARGDSAGDARDGGVLAASIGRTWCRSARRLRSRIALRSGRRQSAPRSGGRISMRGSSTLCATC